MDNAIALQVQTPDSFRTIGNVLNMAQGAQALQSGKQQIQLQGIDLQKAQQANQERLNLQQFMSNPDNFQTNGRIDLDKINSTIPKIAPYTGAQAIDTLTKLGNAQTNAEQAKLNFTSTERNIVGGMYGILGRAGVDDPKVVDAEMDRLKTQYPDNKTLHQYIDGAKVGLNMLPAGQGTLNKTLVTQSQSLLSPEAQQSALAPTAGLQSTGGQINETIMQPAVGGNAPSVSMTGRSAPLTLGPDSRESVVTDPNTGNVNVVTKDAAGNIISSRPAPGSSAAGTGPAPFTRFVPGQKEDIAHAQQETVGIRQAGDQVPQARNINSTILKLSKEAASGPGTQRWQNALGAVSSLWGGTAQVNNYQELGKFLEKNALQNMQAMGGPPSDARLAAAAAANGSTQFNAGALQAVTKFNDATVSALDKYRQGVDKAVGLANSDYTKLPAFKAAWAKNMDVDVFRVENAIRDGDTGELQKIKQELGPDRMRQLAQKRKNLEALSSTGKLP